MPAAAPTPSLLRWLPQLVSVVAFAALFFFIVASQAPTGFGPFRVTPHTPHAGRIVFAGLLQIGVMLWATAVIFRVCAGANLDLVAMAGPAGTAPHSPAAHIRFARDIAVRACLSRAVVCLIYSIQSIHPPAPADARPSACLPTIAPPFPLIPAPQSLTFTHPRTTTHTRRAWAWW